MPEHASTSTARPNIYGAKVMLCIIWRSYPTRRTLQMLIHPTTICFDRWHTAWLISITALKKKSKNGSIRGSPQKTHRFLKMVSDNCHKDGKMREPLLEDGSTTKPIVKKPVGNKTRYFTHLS